jgi:hypothetical protein
MAEGHCRDGTSINFPEGNGLKDTVEETAGGVTGPSASPRTTPGLRVRECNSIIVVDHAWHSPCGQPHFASRDSLTVFRARFQVSLKLGIDLHEPLIRRSAHLFVGLHKKNTPRLDCLLRPGLDLNEPARGSALLSREDSSGTCKGRQTLVLAFDAVWDVSDGPAASIAASIMVSIR